MFYTNRGVSKKNKCNGKSNVPGQQSFWTSNVFVETSYVDKLYGQTRQTNKVRAHNVRALTRWAHKMRAKNAITNFHYKCCLGVDGQVVMTDWLCVGTDNLGRFIDLKSSSRDTITDRRWMGTSRTSSSKSSTLTSNSASESTEIISK